MHRNTLQKIILPLDKYGQMPYTLNIMRDRRIEIRVSDCEKEDMRKLAEKEGFASIGAFLRWLVCFYKCEYDHGKIQKQKH